MQSKLFIATLVMFIQVSQSMPHFEQPAPISFPASSSQPTAITDSAATPNSTEETAPEFPYLNFPTISPDSPEYNQIKELYDHILQIFGQYSFGSQSSSSQEKNDRMNNIFGGDVKEEPANQSPLASLQFLPSISQPPEQPKEQPNEQPKEQHNQQPQPQKGSENAQSNSGATDRFSPQGMLKLVNELRAENGVPPVVLTEALSDDALDHAKYMENINDLTHARAPGNSMSENLKRYGYQLKGPSAENVVVGALTTQDVFNSWKGSEGHLKNMINPAYKEMGVAISGSYASQGFAG